MRVVLDTNVFVSMALGGQVGKINEAWKEAKFTLIVSHAIVAEYLDVLQRPKLHLTSDVVSDLIARVDRKAKLVTPTQSIQAIETDPADNKFLEAALEGKAIYVVSGDRHLLEIKSFCGIKILTAREFIAGLK